MARSLLPPFYVVSDTHWYHKNIIEYCDRPKNHNRLMIDNWIKAVGPDDTVLHLGDLFFGRGEQRVQDMINIGKQLPGRKFIILGNHDNPKLNYQDFGFTVLRPFTIQYRGYEVEFDHYPSDAKHKIAKGEKRIRVHGHIHNNGYAHWSKPKVSYRYANINVSIEELDYTPQPVIDLLDAEIKRLNPKERYINVNGKTRVS